MSNQFSELLENATSKYSLERYLNRSSMEVDSVDSEGKTPLYYAAMAKNLSQCRVLVEAKADINVSASDDSKPLLFALEDKFLSDNLSYLIEAKANVNCSHESVSFFEHVCNLKATKVSQLLDLTNAIKLDIHGKSTLQLAVKTRNMEAFDLLLEDKETRIDHCDYEGNTALNLAIDDDPTFRQMANRLIDVKANVNIGNRDGLLPLVQATMFAAVGPEEDPSVGEEKRKLVHKLIEAKATIDIDGFKKGYTPLCYAAQSGDAALIKTFISGGARINPNSDDYTFPLMEAAKFSSPETVQLLIDSNADVSAVNCEGLSALHYPMMEDINTDMVISLLQSKAVLVANDANTDNIIYKALSTSCVDIVRLIMKNNPKIKLADIKQMITKRRKERAGKYTKHMSNVEDIFNRLNQNPALNKIIESVNTAYEESKQRAGENASIQYKQDDEVIDSVLEQLKSAEAPPAMSLTKLVTLAQEDNIEEVKKLVASGADINVVYNSDTALTAAVKNGNLELVTYLLSAKADVNTLGTGENAVTIASKAGNYSIVNEILTNGGPTSVNALPHFKIITPIPEEFVHVVDKMIDSYSKKKHSVFSGGEIISLASRLKKNEWVNKLRNCHPIFTAYANIYDIFNVKTPQDVKTKEIVPHRNVLLESLKELYGRSYVEDLKAELTYLYNSFH